MDGNDDVIDGIDGVASEMFVKKKIKKDVNRTTLDSESGQWLFYYCFVAQITISSDEKCPCEDLITFSPSLFYAKIR